MLPGPPFLCIPLQQLPAPLTPCRRQHPRGIGSRGGRGPSCSIAGELGVCHARHGGADALGNGHGEGGGGAHGVVKARDEGPRGHPCGECGGGKGEGDGRGSGGGGSGSTGYTRGHRGSSSRGGTGIAPHQGPRHPPQGHGQARGGEPGKVGVGALRGSVEGGPGAIRPGVPHATGHPQGGGAHGQGTLHGEKARGHTGQPHLCPQYHVLAAPHPGSQAHGPCRSRRDRP